MSRFYYHDGGREAAGYTGSTGDCVTRAIAIVTGQSYQTVYEALNEAALRERPRGKKKRSSARTGVHKATWKGYLLSLGYTWVPTMGIGTGCKVHLKREELPSGRLVVACSKHLVAFVDGVIYDTYNPDRDGTRCVYGYFVKKD